MQYQLTINQMKKQHGSEFNISLSDAHFVINVRHPESLPRLLLDGPFNIQYVFSMMEKEGDGQGIQVS